MKKNNNDIPPLPSLPSVILSDDHAPRVQELAEKGFSKERIAIILPLSVLQRSALLLRMDTPDDIYHEAYILGVTSRQKNILEKLKEKAETGDPDAVKAFQEYKFALQESELRYKLFGV